MHEFSLFDGDHVFLLLLFCFRLSDIVWKVTCVVSVFLLPFRSANLHSEVQQLGLVIAWLTSSAYMNSYCSLHTVPAMSIAIFTVIMGPGGLFLLFIWKALKLIWLHKF